MPGGLLAAVEREIPAESPRLFREKGVSFAPHSAAARCNFLSDQLFRDPKPWGASKPAYTTPRRPWPLHRRPPGPAGLPRALPAPPAPSRQRRRVAGWASPCDNGGRPSTA